MNRIATMAVIPILLAGCQPDGNSPPSELPPPRPNVLLIMSDDLGWGDVAYNGNDIVSTPSLDSMARDGIRLDRFYAAAPVCSPTRASLLTGRHPYRLGISWAGEGHLPETEISIAETLRGQGYRTGHFGKWHVGELSRTINQSYFPGALADVAHYSPPWDNGFDISFSTESMMPTYNPYYHVGGEFGTDTYRHLQTEPVAKGRRTGGHRWRDHFWTGPGQIVDEWLAGDSSRIVTDRAVTFIRESVEVNSPFLAVVWYHTPHTPIVAGNTDREQYAAEPMAAQHWYGSITAMDREIGRLRALLRDLRVADNTIVWFNSDNGPSYIHNYNSTGPFRGKKSELLEGGIRVPGIVEWPQQLNGGRSVSAPISTSDIYPTVLAAADVNHPPNQPRLDGIDVLPLLSGETLLRGSAIGFQSPVRQKGSTDSTDRQAFALSGDRYKLISLDDGDTWLLYDLSDDPGESRDLSATYPDVLESMKKDLKSWLSTFELVEPET